MTRRESSSPAGDSVQRPRRPNYKIAVILGVLLALSSAMFAIIEVRGPDHLIAPGFLLCSTDADLSPAERAVCSLPSGALSLQVPASASVDSTFEVALTLDPADSTADTSSVIGVEPVHFSETMIAGLFATDFDITQFFTDRAL